MSITLIIILLIKEISNVVISPVDEFKRDLITDVWINDGGLADRKDPKSSCSEHLLVQSHL